MLFLPTSPLPPSPPSEAASSQAWPPWVTQWLRLISCHIQTPQVEEEGWEAVSSHAFLLGTRTRSQRGRTADFHSYPIASLMLPPEPVCGEWDEMTSVGFDLSSRGGLGLGESSIIRIQHPCPSPRSSLPYSADMVPKQATCLARSIPA